MHTRVHTHGPLQQAPAGAGPEPDDAGPEGASFWDCLGTAATTLHATPSSLTCLSGLEAIPRSGEGKASGAGLGVRTPSPPEWWTVGELRGQKVTASLQGWVLSLGAGQAGPLEET